MPQNKVKDKCLKDAEILLEKEGIPGPSIARILSWLTYRWDDAYDEGVASEIRVLLGAQDDTVD